MTSESTPAFAIRGVDHIAVGTHDMAESLRFYVKVLGFRLVMARRTHAAADADHPLVSDDDPNKERAEFRRPPGAPQYDNIRHYCLDMGNDSVFSLFEYPPGTPTAVRDSVAGLQHIAFHAERPADQAGEPQRPGPVPWIAHQRRHRYRFEPHVRIPRPHP